MKKILVLLLIGVMLLSASGCKESHRRVSVRVVAHGHYGHNCGHHCIHYRPVVVIGHGHYGHSCGNHCSHYRPPIVIHRPIVHRPVIVHKPTVHKPIIHGRGKTEVRVYRIPPMGPRSYGPVGRSGMGGRPSSTNRSTRGNSSTGRGSGRSRSHR